ncbi:MAG TPA: FAD-dependent monooxygenase [Acidimicrobiia bacterium]|nr:FAD-dependent monooxygenase [Acidimicrobiia bacterium]
MSTDLAGVLRRPPTVLVVGGSLGGLTTAVLLAEAGCAVTVWERSPVPLVGRGAGIVLHPVTARYARERTGATLADISEGAAWFRFLDRSGAVTYEEVCRYRFTAWTTLYRNLLSRFPAARYRLGRELAGFQAGRGRVEVRATDGEREFCDLLVCADGIASTARRQLLPAVDPSFSGYLGWRGVVKESELDREAFERLYEAITYHTPGLSHILSYPIPGFDQAGEERILNYVWYRNIAPSDLDRVLTEKQGQRRSMSVAPGRVQDEVVAELKAAAAAVLPPDLSRMVQATAEPFIQAVVDVGVPAMAFGRVCLLGDAAFAARPHAAAGTAKAAADAWDLERELRVAAGDVEAALDRWEPGALRRGDRLVDRARRLGTMAQVEGTVRGGDPTILVGLDQAGDSCFG